MRRKVSEFIPGQSSATPTLSQVEQDAKTGSALAIAAFVTSLATIFLTAGFFSFVGSILGHVSLSKLKKARSDQNRGLAVAGVIIGWVSTGLALLFLIGFIIAVIGISASSDATWWDDLVNEIDTNFNSI
jgi:ABC-type Fe3+-siderophore transport system permease subunit